MAKASNAAKAATNAVKKVASVVWDDDNAKNNVTSAAKSIASTAAKATTSAARKSSGSSSSNKYGDDAYQAADGKWYLHSTGEPLGTGGTNAEWYSMGAGGNGETGSATKKFGTYQSDLDKLTTAKRQAQVDQLKAARKRALANLDVQEQNIKPMYENARNQTSAASQQGARNFAEYLANRGLTNSGAAAQSEINRQSTLTNNLANLATQEANAYRDIANQRTAIENDYAANLANANNAITNDYYNNLLNYNEQQRQYIQALQQQAQGQYANDYQAQINNLLAQGYAPDSMEVLQLAALRGQKANSLYNTGINNALANIQAGNINYNNAAALGMTVPQAQTYYNNYVAQQQAAAQQAAEELARKQAQQDFENEIALKKLANDTAQTQYNINKPYYKSSGGSGGSGGSPSGSQYNGIVNTKNIKSELDGMSTSEKSNYLDNLLVRGLISDDDYQSFYYLYDLPI